nr:MAG TPA: hypothetical protein [Caudoviricetes sp.]
MNANIIVLLPWTVSRMRPLTRTSLFFALHSADSPESRIHRAFDAHQSRNLTRGQEFRLLSARQCTWYPSKFFTIFNFTKANFYCRFVFPPNFL